MARSARKQPVQPKPDSSRLVVKYKTIQGHFDNIASPQNTSRYAGIEGTPKTIFRSIESDNPTREKPRRFQRNKREG